LSGPPFDYIINSLSKKNILYIEAIFDSFRRVSVTILLLAKKFICKSFAPLTVVVLIGTDTAT
jgi:hypothetical protein